MKKYVFIAGVGAIVASLATRQWPVAGLLALGTFIWLGIETRERQRFRFMKGAGFNEANFDLGADATLVEISAGGESAAFATSTQALSVWNAEGRQRWARPLEPGTLALLPLDDGGCYYAVADEIVRCDAQGQVAGRLSFTPPPFLQSYRLVLSADQSTLLLHTPWFLQFVHPDLSALGPRISSEATGHYMKYCSLSPDGARVAFAGAKLLEEERGTEARWGSWKRVDGAWTADWAGAEENYGNSHLRGFTFSMDGKALALELYRESYELRVLGLDGAQRFRRDRVERPCLSPDGSFATWESQLDGLLVFNFGKNEKAWTRKNLDKVRHKALGARACLAIEGRRGSVTNMAGNLVSEAWFVNDPFRIVASADGFSLAVVMGSKAGVLRFRDS